MVISPAWWEKKKGVKWSRAQRLSFRPPGAARKKGEMGHPRERGGGFAGHAKKATEKHLKKKKSPPGGYRMKGGIKRFT